MRVAFSITLNGIHHFQNNNYLERLLGIFDYVVIAEGAVESKKGSAKWTGRVSDDFHSNGRSNDGTYKYLMEMEDKYDNLYLISFDGLWTGKDEMVNSCLIQLKELVDFKDNIWLWQIDPDEIWSNFKIVEVEKLLDKYDSDCAVVKFHQMMGKNKIAIGSDWGGNHVPRVWRWKGELFQSHAPAILKNWKGNTINVPHKFIHNSYYFEKDVLFKANWYFRSKKFYNNWKNIQSDDVDNYKTSDLIPNIPGSRSKIVSIPNEQIEFSYTMYDEDITSKDIFSRNDSPLSFYNDEDYGEKYVVYYNTIRQLMEVREDIKILDFNVGNGSNYILLDSVMESLGSGYSYYGMDNYYKDDGLGKIESVYSVVVEIGKSNIICFDKRINLMNFNYDLIMIDGNVSVDDLVRDLTYAISSKDDKTWIFIHGGVSDEGMGVLKDLWRNNKYEEYMSIPIGDGSCLIR